MGDPQAPPSCCCTVATGPAKLGRGGYAVALDSRGHGDSGWPADGDCAISSFAVDVRAVATTLSAHQMLAGDHNDVYTHPLLAFLDELPRR